MKSIYIEIIFVLNLNRNIFLWKEINFHIYIYIDNIKR